MSYIADCRKDEFYNEKYLKRREKDFVEGYDTAVEVLEVALSSIQDEFENACDIARVKPIVDDDFWQALAEGLEMYAESGRNEMIVGFIDSMTDEEYEQRKSEVD